MYMDDTTRAADTPITDDDAAIEAALARLRESEDVGTDTESELTPQIENPEEVQTTPRSRRLWLKITLALMGALALGTAILAGYIVYIDYQQTDVVPLGISLSQAPSQSIQGLSRPELETALREVAHDLSTGSIAVSAAGSVVTLHTEDYLSLDVTQSIDLILNQRNAHSWWEKAQHDVLGVPFGPLKVTLEGQVNTQAISTFVNEFAKAVNAKPKNATSKQVDGSMVITPERSGRTLQADTTAELIVSALNNQLKNGQVTARIEAPVDTIKPKITRKALEKPAIIVDLSARTVKLFDGEQLEKTYRCATGSPGFPTPEGNFKIVAKRYLPTWVNPAPSGWGSTMPERIPPGPSNPLGLRALNLNVPNIRIHGTQNIASIGTAASHGCIRLANSDVVDLYPRVEVGTKVYIIP